MMTRGGAPVDAEPWRAIRAEHPAGRLEPIEAGHPDVHQHDVGAEPPGQPNGRLAVRCLGHDGDVGLRLEDHPEARPDEGLVVGHEDPQPGRRRRPIIRSGCNRHDQASRAGSGSQARTA